MQAPAKLSALTVLALVAASPAISATTIYSTDFTGFVISTDFVNAPNIIYGGISPGVNFVKANSEIWGKTSGGNFNSDVAQPNTTANQNHRFIGLFLDPSLFASTGAGTYSVSFNITGVSGANATYNAFVYAGSGYDLSSAEDKRLNLSLSTANAPISTTGTGVTASLLTSRNLSTEATTASQSSVSFDFTYDGTSAIAFAVGGYANGSVIDNFAITTNLTAVPEPSSFAALAGLGALGAVALRRRRRD